MDLTFMQTKSLRESYQAVGDRGPGFESLRLGAASAVVLHHSLKIEYDIVADDWIHQYSGGYTQLGLLAVSIFFALSGFLVTPGLMKSGDVVSYLSRRFMRIMPLLSIIVVFTAFLVGPFFSSLSASEYYSSATTWLYLKNITTVLSLQLPGVTDYDGGDTINGPIWTLHFEWICYLLLAVLMASKVLLYRWLFLAFYCLGSLALAGMLEPLTGFVATGKTRTFLFLFGYFGAGVLMYLFNDLIPWSRRLVLFALVALLGVLLTPLKGYLAPLLIAYITIGLGLFRIPTMPFTKGVDLSYGVYLSHSVILMVLMNLFAFQSSIVLFSACLALSYLFAFATWHLVESPALERKDLPAQLARRSLERCMSLFGLRPA